MPLQKDVSGKKNLVERYVQRKECQSPMMAFLATRYFTHSSSDCLPKVCEDSSIYDGKRFSPLISMFINFRENFHSRHTFSPYK